MMNAKNILLIAVLFSSISQAARLKDIASIRGVRENQLIGYGLVVGLKGTGDSQAEFTSKSFARLIEKMGVKLDQTQISSKNVAAVIITASLPAFAKAGNPLDVTSVPSVMQHRLWVEHFCNLRCEQRTIKFMQSHKERCRF